MEIKEGGGEEVRAGEEMRGQDEGDEVKRGEVMRIMDLYRGETEEVKTQEEGKKTTVCSESNTALNRTGRPTETGIYCQAAPNLI